MEWEEPQTAVQFCEKLPQSKPKLPSRECWAGTVCNITHTVLVTDCEQPEEDCSKAVVDPEATAGTISQSAPRRASLGDLRSIFPWLPQYMDTVAYDKLIKSHFNQINFPPQHYLVMLSYILKRNNINKNTSYR